MKGIGKDQEKCRKEWRGVEGIGKEGPGGMYEGMEGIG